MSFLLQGIDDKVVSLSFSAIATALSCYTLWRAVRSERRVRALAFAQRKTEALNLITNGEVASLATQDSWREIADAAAEAGLEDSQREATERVNLEEIVLGKFREARQAMMLRQSSTMTHDQLVEFIESQLANLGDLTNGDKAAGENSGVLRSFRRQIEVAKLVEEKFTAVVGEIDGSRRAFLQFYMELRDLQDACRLEGKGVAAEEIDEKLVDIADRLARLGDARSAIAVALARKSTTDVRLKAAKDMAASKAAIDETLGAQNAEDLIVVARHKIKRLMMA